MPGKEWQRILERVTAVKDKDGTFLIGDDEDKGSWLDHFDDLVNVENEREDLEGLLPVQGQIAKKKSLGGHYTV